MTSSPITYSSIGGPYVLGSDGNVYNKSVATGKYTNMGSSASSSGRAILTKYASASPVAATALKGAPTASVNSAKTSVAAPTTGTVAAPAVPAPVAGINQTASSPLLANTIPSGGLATPAPSPSASIKTIAGQQYVIGPTGGIIGVSTPQLDAKYGIGSTTAAATNSNPTPINVPEISSSNTTATSSATPAIAAPASSSASIKTIGGMNYVVGPTGAIIGVSTPQLDKKYGISEPTIAPESLPSTSKPAVTSSNSGSATTVNQPSSTSTALPVTPFVGNDGFVYLNGKKTNIKSGSPDAVAVLKGPTATSVIDISTGKTTTSGGVTTTPSSGTSTGATGSTSTGIGTAKPDPTVVKMATPGGTTAGAFNSVATSGVVPSNFSKDPNIQAAASLYSTNSPAAQGLNNSQGWINQLESAPQQALSRSGLGAPETPPAHMADGGIPVPGDLRPGNIAPPHMGGLFHGNTGGRSDVLPRTVPVDSHVIPADIVSGLGDGNTSAGASILHGMFNSGPFGMKLSHFSGHPRLPHAHSYSSKSKISHLAKGGGTKPRHTQIIAASGEFLVPPEKVAEIGGGDIKKGHAILDKFILNVRKKTADKLRKLPPPKK